MCVVIFVTSSPLHSLIRKKYGQSITVPILESISTAHPAKAATYDELFLCKQLYEPLADGADMWVVHGLQGGTWTMPALRTTGIGPLSEVTCSMVTDKGEQVSRVASETRFFLATDGLLDVQAYPIPVQHASPNERLEIDDLYGLDAILECTVIDGKGRGASVTLEVVLARG